MKRTPSIITILLATILLVTSFLVFERYQSFSALNQEAAELENELQSQEEYFAKLQEVSKKLEENKDLLLKIESALPDNPEIPELLAFIQKSASQAGLILGNINISSASEDETMKKTKLNFILSGEYDGLKKIISIIENSSRLIEIENVFFTYPEAGTLFNFNLKIVSYSY